MPAKDVYHDAVRFALIKDGWEILTEDYTLEYGGDRLYVDIAAEKSLAAQKQGRKILVEVKSFLGRSFVNDGSPVHTVISKSYLNKQANSFSRKEWKLLKP